MTSALPTRGSAGERHAEVTGPDWDVVPFEVGCARCGRDLRGLTEPKCRACGLEFDWSKAVPIEQLVCRKCDYHLYGLTEARCPECGEAFTWAQALDDFHRRQKPLFEYRWREEPIRSLVRTWWLSLRPWKLWQSIDIHDRPRVGPLLTMLVVATITVLIMGMILNYIEIVFDRWRFARLMAARGRPVSIVLPSAALFFGWRNEPLIELVRCVALWGVFTFSSLLLFQQSMRRCKVRTAHVFRVCVYAVIAIAPLAAAIIFTTLAIIRGLGIFGWEAHLAAVALALILGFAAWSVGLAYRRYIRMAHSLAVVIAAQIMALLTSIIVGMWFFLTPRGLMLEMLSWLG